jgi:hypothetical protein
MFVKTQKDVTTMHIITKINNKNKLEKRLIILIYIYRICKKQILEILILTK